MNAPRIPENLCGILRELKKEKVVLLLETGDRIEVKILNVVDDIVIASTDRRFVFINCDCICAIIADCVDLISTRFELAYE
ncbi:MAG: hypothetical protein GX050_08545 [Firmicutes bacterium]|nr:hypothetical protein [Bacillota bacterium]